MKSAASRIRFLALGGLFALAATMASAQTCVSPPSGMVAWWPGDGNTTDIRGSNHGSFVGDPLFAPGFFANAFSFTGTVDPKTGIPNYVAVHDDPSLNPASALTVDTWVFFRGTPKTGDPKEPLSLPFGSGAILVKAGMSEREGKTGYGLLVRDGKLSFFVSIAGAGSLEAAASAPPVDTWTHVAGVYDGRTITLLVNGLGVASQAASGSLESAGLQLHIGHDPFERAPALNGLVDEAEVFERALSQTEILAIMKQGKCKDTSIKVTIDIKPGSDPNSINLSSAGTVPVAIFSSETFDATQINPESVSLAGASVKMVGKSGKYLCSAEDVNSDGRLDLVCHVVTALFMIEPGDSVATLEALTFEGKKVRGEDSIRIVPD